MTLRLGDRWIWDFWTVSEGDDVHVFFLQAPRALGDPELRHWNVSIGHAVSKDLQSWRVLPDALAPGEPGAFDDLTTWTGSIIAHGGTWHMLYTGTARADQGLIQRIGLATSPDLITWTRRPGPVFQANPRWYEELDRDAWHDQAWRDPWLFEVPGDEWLHAYVTARAPSGDPRGRGVIGHARSRDLVQWEVLPPVTEAMGFGQMEVPQLVEAGGRFHLLFSSDPGTRAGVLDHIQGTGTFCLSGPTALGPFDRSSLRTLDVGRNFGTYAGKVVPFRGGLRFLSWIGDNGDGTFRGELLPPRPAKVDRSGRLHLPDLSAT